MGDHHELKPLILTERETYRYVGIPAFVQNGFCSSRRAKPGEGNWSIVVRQGGCCCATPLDRESVDRAYELAKQGFKPPPIPSRFKAKTRKGGPEI
jgi:hypothetical protein